MVSLLFIVICLFNYCVFGDLHRSGSSYDYFCTGNCTNVSPRTYGGVVFMGGGTDVDEAFIWLGQRAGGGNLLILRTDPPGDYAYNSYILELVPCQSVATLIINSTEASQEPFVMSVLDEAEGFFFAGGDQSTYLAFWKGPIANAVSKAIAQRNAPFGGTSAGMAVLANVIFSASLGTVESDPMLQDPLSPNVTLAKALFRLPYGSDLPIITDMHFQSRNRMGRLIVFLARALLSTPSSPIVGLACNEQSALLLDTISLLGRVVGPTSTSACYAVTPTQQRAPVMFPQKPLTWTSKLAVQKMVPGIQFDMKAFTFLDPLMHVYTLTVQNGHILVQNNNNSVY